MSIVGALTARDRVGSGVTRDEGGGGPGGRSVVLATPELGRRETSGGRVVPRRGVAGKGPIAVRDRIGTPSIYGSPLTRVNLKIHVGLDTSGSCFPRTTPRAGGASGRVGARRTPRPGPQLIVIHGIVLATAGAAIRPGFRKDMSPRADPRRPGRRRARPGRPRPSRRTVRIGTNLALPRGKIEDTIGGQGHLSTRPAPTSTPRPPRPSAGRANPGPSPADRARMS